MGGGTWKAAVYGVAKSRTWLRDFTFTFHIHALDKEMAIHSSVLAWRIPGTGEPGRLLSMGSHRVGQDWSDLAAVVAAAAAAAAAGGGFSSWTPSPFFLIYLLSALGLSCGTQNFSLCFLGFSLVVACGLQNPWALCFAACGSRVVANGCSSCSVGLVALWHVGS